MNIATKRILKEYKDLENSKKLLNDSGVYFHYDESNIKKMYAMIVGPEDTPYAFGYYFFEFDFPDNYPMSPPVAKYCTQGKIMDKQNNRKSVRFNPNLYVCGKVCLSMLNTWQGPGWMPTNTITNVLVAIQGLVLNDNPLENEPGFEDLKGDDRKKYMTYNNIIEYANWTISIKEMIENTPNKFINFKKDMIDNLHKNYEKIISKIEKKKEEFGTSQIEVHNSAYGMLCFMDFDVVLSNLIELKGKNPLES